MRGKRKFDLKWSRDFSLFHFLNSLKIPEMNILLKAQTNIFHNLSTLGRYYADILDKITFSAVSVGLTAVISN